MENLETLLAHKRWARWTFGFLCWVAIVLFFSTRTPAEGHFVPWTRTFEISAGSWFVWALCVPAIIGIERWFRRLSESLVYRLLFHVPASFAVCVVALYTHRAMTMLLDGQFRSFSLSYAVLRSSWTGIFHYAVLTYWGILGVYIAWESTARLRDQKLLATDLERELLEARLGTLRNQLHPHFLFNALNAISAHVEKTPRTARRMLEQLGDLLRLSLSHSEDQEIALAEEMEFIEKYMSLQQARFGDRLKVTITTDPEVMGVMVPTFLLEPFVENAIRHGVAPRSEGGQIEIGAGREPGDGAAGECLLLHVRDDGPGVPLDWDFKNGDGIGIRNTRERLQCLYGDRQTLRISGSPGAGVLVEIRIPYRQAYAQREVPA